MATIQETIESIISAGSWDQRVAKFRLIPQNHGTNDHTEIMSAVARALYVPYLAPDYAYVHELDFYGKDHFESLYAIADSATHGFTRIAVDDLASVIEAAPETLLVFRTIMGLTKQEFAHTTGIVAPSLNLNALSASKVDSMEQKKRAISKKEALVVANTLTNLIEGTLFGEPRGKVVSKQTKPDTDEGWKTVQTFARDGVPFSLFLHQRHYGGAFRQLLDATSTKRGDIIEDAVESLFLANGIPYIRTGSHNQADIARTFEVTVLPAPDFVVFDNKMALRGILECKLVNDGGTARDKAPRFSALKDEATRLGGIPLLAVLGGLGWKRLNDALGPVVRDTDGRVFTLRTLDQMLTVAPFPQLIDLLPRK